MSATGRTETIEQSSESGGELPLVPFGSTALGYFNSCAKLRPRRGPRMDVAYSAGVERRRKRRWRLHLPERLPDLRGKWLVLYSVVWAIVLPLAIFGSIRSTYISAGYWANPAWLPHGFGTESLPDGLKISAVTSTDAERAGLRAEDRIVAINGWKVPRSSAAGALARTHMGKTEGARTTLTLLAQGQPTRDVRVTYSRRHFEEPFIRARVSNPL